jgi:DNA-binding response OmpR family regulator
MFGRRLRQLLDIATHSDRAGSPTQSDNGHILVVDDQQEICDLVQDYLTSEGYRVSTAHDGPGMRRVLSQAPVDLVILDLMLPGEDGLTLARALRSESGIGIIILTGRGETVDRIIGLEMGADDYLPKPFHLRELLARVKSVLRRVQSRTACAPSHVARQFAGWNLDLSAASYCPDRGVGCHPEFDCCSFRQQSNQVLSRDRLLARATGRPGRATGRSMCRSDSYAASSR